MIKPIISLLCSVLLLTACGGKKTTGVVAPEGTPVTLSHAKGFGLSHMPGYTTVTVYNPWKPGEVYDTYYLVKSDTVTVPADGHKVLIPLQSLMSNSATHLGFLDRIGELDKVTGVCSADYIYSPIIRQGIADGRVKDLGDAFNLDIESLLLLHPQAVMTTAYNADDENSRRMKQTGLTLIYNIEWQEPTLLGRAEWIKFIAAFFDRSELADSLFNEVAQQYQDIQAKVTLQSLRPSIFSGQDFRGAWSMPGGQSYAAQLFRDAGADYYYSNDSTTGSIASNIEEALIHFNQADIWVGTQVSSLQALESTNGKYKLFKAFREGRVYNYNKRTNASGGNDYWETGVARPDLLLKDMVKICHPHLFPEYELTYMERLSQP